MYVIGISGGVASGKTTLAKQISSMFDNVTVLSLDNYFYPYSELSLEERKKIDFDNPQVYDYDLIVKHINMLSNNQEVELPTYSFADYTRGEETIKLQPPKVLIVEGYAVLHNEKLRKLLNYSVFVDVDEKTQLNRMLKRDVLERARTESEILNHFNTTIKSSNQNYIQPQKQYANLVVMGGVK